MWLFCSVVDVVAGLCSQLCFGLHHYLVLLGTGASCQRLKIPRARKCPQDICVSVTCRWCCEVDEVVVGVRVLICGNEMFAVISWNFNLLKREWVSRRVLDVGNVVALQVKMGDTRLDCPTVNDGAHLWVWGLSIFMAPHFLMINTLFIIEWYYGILRSTCSAFARFVFLMLQVTNLQSGFGST